MLIGRPAGCCPSLARDRPLRDARQPSVSLTESTRFKPAALTATVASYFVGQDLDRAKTDRAMLKAKLEQSRADRENLSLKLDVLQAQLAELLNRM